MRGGPTRLKDIRKTDRYGTRQYCPAACFAVRVVLSGAFFC